MFFLSPLTIDNVRNSSIARDLSDNAVGEVRPISSRTVLFIILLSCLRSDIVILDTLIVFTYLLTYLLTQCLLYTFGTGFTSECKCNVVEGGVADRPIG